MSNDDFQRLKKQIVDMGFSDPISVWQQGKNYFVLDGHQRLRTVAKMVEQGFHCPPLPVNLIEAHDKHEAKRKLLAMTSQYGKVERQGLYEFLQGTDIQPDELYVNFRLPEIDLPSFTEEMYVDRNHGDDNDMGNIPGIGGGMEGRDSEPSGRTASDDGQPKGQPKTSHVKTVSLYFDEATQREFADLCIGLQELFDVANLTDTVMEAVRFAHENAVAAE